MNLDDMLGGWLHGRSLARSLPAPVRDGRGWRVDTGTATERARLVYPGALPEIAERAAAIRTKDMPIKACCEAVELQALLGPRWSVERTGTFMVGATNHAAPDDRPLSAGYVIEMAQHGTVGTVLVRDPSRTVVASGHCAGALGVFVFDRIATHPAHRRRGLGRSVMAALGRLQRNPCATRALVATAEGRALYLTLGWTGVSPYATALRVMEWSG